ncbi:hypothetical protein BDU57DRAFT_487756 [Ampelomyces quisqualis]|uniref:Aminoglycoside phosphotransferase domain-containing protein n=1 Tax=Ampelomyces quisqualis TaxID=50730 RepID=A0A6A5QZP5_AMPQU|nr:hypothetical protein BDU57DRAFT_487756 [Ampelomyces quisqualis]
MDTDPSELLWSPEIALRSKEQVMLEDWKVDNPHTGFQIRCNRGNQATPADQETWNTLKPPTLKPDGVKIYYQTPSSPPILSFQQLKDATEKDSLHRDMGLHNEAETLLFLAEKRPELRIPTVLTVWSIPVVDGVNTVEVYCLMMNFIQGITLSQEQFSQLPIHAQDIICAKVSSQLAYLRELPSEGYYGRPYGQGWLRPPPGINTNTSATNAIVGPYKTYKGFCAAINRANQAMKSVGYGGMLWPPKHQEITTKLMSIFPDWAPHEPKLTWIDPKLANLVVRQVKANDGSEDWEVTLIDWECTGWYPAWVQALQVHCRFGVTLIDRGPPLTITAYRDAEITAAVLKSFDPEPDHERIATAGKYSWCFF